jgi:hypothetical protein
MPEEENKPVGNGEDNLLNVADLITSKIAPETRAGDEESTFGDMLTQLATYNYQEEPDADGINSTLEEVRAALEKARGAEMKTEEDRHKQQVVVEELEQIVVGSEFRREHRLPPVTVQVANVLQAQLDPSKIEQSAELMAQLLKQPDVREEVIEGLRMTYSAILDAKEAGCETVDITVLRERLRQSELTVRSSINEITDSLKAAVVVARSLDLLRPVIDAVDHLNRTKGRDIDVVWSEEAKTLRRLLDLRRQKVSNFVLYKLDNKGLALPETVREIPSEDQIEQYIEVLVAKHSGEDLLRVSKEEIQGQIDTIREREENLLGQTEELREKERRTKPNLAHDLATRFLSRPVGAHRKAQAEQVKAKEELRILAGKRRELEEMQEDANLSQQAKAIAEMLREMKR